MTDKQKILEEIKSLEDLAKFAKKMGRECLSRKFLKKKRKLEKKLKKCEE